MSEQPDDGLLSPPYPKESVTGLVLYKQLILLHRWLVAEQETIRELLPIKARSKIELPATVPSEGVWELVSVFDRFQTFMTMRRIRELWDRTFAEHEDEWDNKLAIRKRFSILLLAQSVLNEAFVDAEVREARNAKEIERAERIAQVINEQLTKMFVPLGLQDELKKSAAADDWWSESDVDLHPGENDDETQTGGESPEAPPANP